MEEFFACQKHESAFKALQGQRALQCTERNQRQSEQQTGTQRESVHPGPLRAPFLLQLWLQSLSRSALVWIPGSGLWICLCFHDNPVLFEPCLLAGCYIWIHPGNPTLWCQLVTISEAPFRSAHPTPGFQLHSTLLSFHHTHAHTQDPASTLGYRPPFPPNSNAGMLDTFLCEMMKIQ